MRDYYDQQPYDRKWIYRAVREGVIVDVIWAMANSYCEVSEAWLRRGPEAGLYAQRFALLAPVEMIWTKVHVLQRDRCDWPDLINLLYACGSKLDWQRLIDGFPGEERLLGALVLLFTWLAPGRAAALPHGVWERLQIAPPEGAGLDRDAVRIDRLDSRPWFTGAEAG
jgi:hypothetical protein